MNLLMPVLVVVEGLKGLGRKLLVLILQASTEEVITEIQAQSAAAKRKGLETTLEALEYADQLDAQVKDKDEAKKEAIAAYREGIGELARTTQALLKYPVSTDKMPEALDRPFADAKSFETATNGLPRPTPKALSKSPETPNPSPAPADTPFPKRGRGRPKKHPRPQGNGNGPTTDRSPLGQEDPEL